MGTLSEVCGGPSSGLSLAGLKQHERDQEKESQQRSACFGHFSSTAAVYGNPERLPVREDDATVPTSPYGSSKLMTEIMLRDAGGTHGLPHVILRYFNVAGADPLDRTGQSTKRATHLIKVSVETALGLRPKVHVFGTDYPTPDGTCIRDYIQVSDLVRFPSKAIAYCLREAGFALSDVQHVAVNQDNLASFCQCTTVGSRTQLSRESTENARIAY
jgi:nucleoside-diphosphate-sugar epimerase